MDGATATNLMLNGMPQYSCPAQWILENPSALQQLHHAFLQAGSRIICTPTAQANAVMLEKWELQDKMAEYNRQLAQLTVETCRQFDPSVLVAGVVAPLEIQAEPFGETPFLDLVGIYASQALALKEGGVDLLIADTMTTISQSRAAILGCRQAGLPVMVTLNVEEDGETCMGSDLVSALIVCQNLGAAAFGLSCCDRPEKLYHHIEEIAPYAKIPLIVRPRAGEDFDRMLSPEEMAEQMRGLLSRGATLVGGCCYTTPEHIAKIGQMMREFDFHSVHVEKEDAQTILMAGATEPYFLDEYFDQTEPIYCRRDMSDELLELEESGADVATICIETVDDVDRAVNDMYHSGLLTLVEREDYREQVVSYLNNPVHSAWFDGRYKVINERDILFCNSGKARPDRVMVDGKKAIVVDYKFGQKEEKSYIRQVCFYCKTLRQMGYTDVAGYIWYVPLGKVVSV